MAAHAAVLAVPKTVTPEEAPAPPAPAEEKKNEPADVKRATPRAPPGQASFATRTLQVGANQTIAALSVKRLNSTRGRARVAWTIEDGTARRGVHYELGDSQVIEFLDGQSVRSLFIPLMPERDDGMRRSKTFTVKLQQTTGGLALGEIKQVYVTIVGDLDAPVETQALPQSTSRS